MKLKQIKVNGPYEIVAAVGRTSEDKRRILLVSAYFPPKMKVEQVTEMNEKISSLIDQVRTKNDSPLVFVCGDMNKKPVDILLQDHPVLQVLPTAPTRGDEVLDLCLTNADMDRVSARVMDPLSSDTNTPSDHRVVRCQLQLPRCHFFTKNTFTYRPINDAGIEMFGNRLVGVDWAPIYQMEVNQAVEFMDNVTDAIFSDSFPERTKTIKSTDSPWMTRRLRCRIRNRKRYFKKRGKRLLWKRKQKEVAKEIKDAKHTFLEKVKDNVKESGNTRGFFSAIKCLKTAEAPKKWKITDMMPGAPLPQIAEDCAEFFSKISNEYDPLPKPSTNEEGPAPTVEMYEVAAKLRHAKKPKSQVKGDLHPKLVEKYADLLAIPLTYIYNMILKKCEWPDLWKSETVRLIPKSTIPEEIKDLRNLSCTPVYSKILESVALKELQKDVPLSVRQYGGIKGSGVDHFLAETWHEIFRGLDGGGKAMSLLSIDFQKAFNRMSHAACIRQLTVSGARTEWINVVAAFLYNRTMTVHIDGVTSTTRKVPGGAPQGSVLGSYLFCVTTDGLSAPQDRNSFSQNGSEHSLSSGDDERQQLSPIGRDWTAERHPDDLLDITLSEDEEDVQFPTNIRKRGLLDTTVQSYLANGSELIGMDDAPVHCDEPETKAYIDDYNVIEMVPLANAVSHITQNKTTYRVHARGSEKIFDDVSLRSGWIGMVVNPEKTQILCIHPEGNLVRSYINTLTEDGAQIRLVSGDGLKILGFHFGPKPNADAHVGALIRKYNTHLWAMRFLKRNTMNQTDLLFVYKTIIRPILDYAVPTYTSLLTREQVQQLERLQAKTMKIIYGEHVSYRTIIEQGIIETLEDRRRSIVLKFAEKCSNNDRYREKWFPENTRHDHQLRRREKYFIPKMNTYRYNKSPIVSMRRILNEKLTS